MTHMFDARPRAARQRTRALVLLLGALALGAALLTSVASADDSHDSKLGHAAKAKGDKPPAADKAAQQGEPDDKDKPDHSPASECKPGKAVKDGKCVPQDQCAPPNVVKDGMCVPQDQCVPPNVVKDGQCAPPTTPVTPVTNATPPTPAATPATPAAGAAPVAQQQQRQPAANDVAGTQARSASANLRLQRRCATRTFRATVSGRSIRRVTFLVAGRRVRTVTMAAGRRSLTVSVPVRRFGARRQSVQARVSFRNGARSRTLTVSGTRCAQGAVSPQFTG